MFEPKVSIVILFAILQLFVSSFAEDDLPKLPHTIKLEVCNNSIVNDIPGGAEAVLQAGLLYLESMKNNSISPITDFTGAWKYEPYRVAGPMIPQCKSFKHFGDVRISYDETKRFCDITNGKFEPTNVNDNVTTTCTTYSIGSNNKWHFEEYMFRDSNCTIETFDCTCDVTIPEAIRSRTRFHKSCLSTTSGIGKNGWKFITYGQLTEMLGRKKGPEYMKMDVEGFEWSVLRTIVRYAYHHPEAQDSLPLQVYAEFHLNKDATSDNREMFHSGQSGYTARRLRHFLDELFIKAGYMVMYMGATYQTRNTDMLLVKLFCPSAPHPDIAPLRA